MSSLGNENARNHKYGVFGFFGKVEGSWVIVKSDDPDYSGGVKTSTILQNHSPGNFREQLDFCWFPSILYMIL